MLLGHNMLGHNVHNTVLISCSHVSVYARGRVVTRRQNERACARAREKASQDCNVSFLDVRGSQRDLFPQTCAFSQSVGARDEGEDGSRGGERNSRLLLFLPRARAHTHAPTALSCFCCSTSVPAPSTSSPSSAPTRF